MLTLRMAQNTDQDGCYYLSTWIRVYFSQATKSVCLMSTHLASIVEFLTSLGLQGEDATFIL